MPLNAAQLPHPSPFKAGTCQLAQNCHRHTATSYPTKVPVTFSRTTGVVPIYPDQRRPGPFCRTKQVGPRQAGWAAIQLIQGSITNRPTTSVCTVGNLEVGKSAWAAGSLLSHNFESCRNHDHRPWFTQAPVATPKPVAHEPLLPSNNGGLPLRYQFSDLVGARAPGPASVPLAPASIVPFKTVTIFQCPDYTQQPVLQWWDGDVFAGQTIVFSATSESGGTFVRTGAREHSCFEPGRFGQWAPQTCHRGTIFSSPAGVLGVGTEPSVGPVYG